MDWLLIFSVIFLASVASILFLTKRRKRVGDDQVGAQFVVTGTLLLIFYIVCFCSGVCTILNFLFRWIF